MANKLEVKKKLFAKSDRVKSVDIHPTEPWILSALYSGKVLIWDYKTEQLVKSFEVCEQPVRCAKFVPRKQWVITGSDDMFIRVYNYNTMGKIKAFEAHTDFIRSLAIHPTQPYILTSSDDMLIKLWDWDKNWQCTQVFEGHTHYVMMITFNPKDPTTFASASLDRTIKVWSLSSPVPNYTLEAHERGVNSVSYFGGGDKPYIVSGGDDRLVKIWDYLNKSCVQVLDGHTHNVTAACFHPTLPLIISGSEDNSIQVWNSNTYKLEKTLNYGMDRVWSINYLNGSNSIAFGYDEGTILVKFGREDPVVSMDSNGKIIWAKQSEIQQVNVKQASTLVDGEKIALPSKDLGTSEFFPQILKHSNNGRFVAVCGDGEFIIYTSVAWRNKSFGKGLDFAWGEDTGEYVVRESSSKIKIFKNFAEHNAFRPNFTADGLFGGRLIGIKGSNFFCFYDWEDGKIIRRIDITPKAIHWSKSGELVVITCDTSFFILKYNYEAVLQAKAAQQETEDGYEDAFEVLHEINERVRGAMWVEDCFIYTTQSRLNYCVAGEVVTLAHLDRTLYPLGYIPNQSRVYLIDKSLNIVSYSLEITVINYQTAIAREDFETASQILPKIPFDHRNRIAQFLDARGLKEMALEVATEPDLRFELAIQLNKLRTAYDLAKTSDSELKWKQLGDTAILNCEYDLARECLVNAKDLGSLLLLFTSLGDENGLKRLAEIARAEGINNIAFVCHFLLHQLDECIAILTETKRTSEAAFLARTYLPSKISSIVKLWKEDLKKLNAKAAESLADPEEYPNLFPDLEEGLSVERYLNETARKIPANRYLDFKEFSTQRNLIEEATKYFTAKSNSPQQVPVVENIVETQQEVQVPDPVVTEEKKELQLTEDQEIDELLKDSIDDLGDDVELTEDIVLEDLE